MNRSVDEPVLQAPEPPVAVRPVPDDLAARLARDYGVAVDPAAAVSVWRQGVMVTAKLVSRKECQRMGWRIGLRKIAARRAAARREAGA